MPNKLNQGNLREAETSTANPSKYYPIQIKHTQVKQTRNKCSEARKKQA
jgi:hypothetical protein